jgi:hypothetical protein
VINNLKRVYEVGGEILPSAPDLFWLYGKSSNTQSMASWNGFMKQVTSGLEFDHSIIIFFSFIGASPTDYDIVFTSLFEPVREAKVIPKKPASLLLINHCSLKPEILLRVANILS